MSDFNKHRLCTILFLQLLLIFSFLIEKIIKHSRQCLTTFPNSDLEVASLFIIFSTLFLVFGNVVKHSLLCLIDYFTIHYAVVSVQYISSCCRWITCLAWYWQAFRPMHICIPQIKRKVVQMLPLFLLVIAGVSCCVLLNCFILWKSDQNFT